MSVKLITEQDLQEFGAELRAELRADIKRDTREMIDDVLNVLSTMMDRIDERFVKVEKQQNETKQIVRRHEGWHHELAGRTGHKLSPR